MIDPAITRGLVHKENGVWISPKITDVSYPKGKHQFFFSVEENSFWFQHRNDCIIEILQRFPPKKYIIDVGGGNGFVSLGIQNAGFNVIMLEAGSDGVMNAQKRGIKDILHTTFQDADFPNSSVDCIGSFDVLEHIEDDYAFLNIAFRCIRKEGKLYVTVPAHQYLWSWMDIQAGHFRRYSMTLLTKLLNRSGFEVIYISYFFSGLSLPIFFFRTLPTFLRLPQNRSREKKAKIHRKKTGFIGRVLDWHWNHEIRSLKTDKFFYGASLIAVAKPIKS